MKIILLGITAFLFTLNAQAQNKNIKTEVKTTVTTIKDSDGEKKLIKTERIEEVQKIELEDANSNVLNKEVKESPIQVTETTEITANGVTRIIDVDRSAYYDIDGSKYQIVIDEKGYNILSPSLKKTGVLRKTSNNNYIYKIKNKISFGHFDENGNLVLETYDEKNDKVIIETYSVIKE